MGKTWTRNPNDENYSGDMKNQRKANKAQRRDRRRAEQQLDANLEMDEDDVRNTDIFASADRY